MLIKNIGKNKIGDACLVLTEDVCFLVDAGASCETGFLVSEVQNTLQGRPLDFVFLTHSHYDHIGALPGIRQAYPNVVVYGSSYGKGILEKPSALSAIRAMGQVGDHVPDYDDDLLKIDIPLADQDLVEKGNFHLKAFTAIGHTRCTMAFLINDSLLFSSESLGAMDKQQRIYCVTLVDFDAPLQLMAHFLANPPKKLFCPHYGLVDDPKAFLEKSMEVTQKTKEYYLQLMSQGKNDDEILDLALQQYHQEGDAMNQYPLSAFTANTTAMIHLSKKIFTQS